MYLNGVERENFSLFFENYCNGKEFELFYKCSVIEPANNYGKEMKNMRLRLSYSIESFPIAYRLTVMSLIKATVKGNSKNFYQKYFVENAAKTKDYSFACYFPNIRIKDEKIFADRVLVTISSENLTLMMHLLNGSRVGALFEHSGTKMQLDRVEMIKEKKITKPYAWFQTCSPILVEDKQGNPLTASDPNFESELNIISNKIIQSNLGRPLYQPLKIEKNQLKKKVIKENFHQAFKGYLYFTTSAGRFLISGHPSDLTYFYHNGYGLRSQCFGLVDKID
jgi:CRISPR-associated endoribonuclease Cas6